MSTASDELEVIGLISTQYGSETHAVSGPVIDKSYVGAIALAHENAGFDRVLIGYNSASPDPAQGNSTSQVGTPEQVVDALLDYYDLGITKFLFRGFDPLEDAIDYGRHLLPLFRQAVRARRSAGVARAAAVS